MIQIISTKVYRKYQQLFVIQNILETCPLSNVKTKYKSNEELSITIELFSIEEEIVISYAIKDDNINNDYIKSESLKHIPCKQYECEFSIFGAMKKNHHLLNLRTTQCSMKLNFIIENGMIIFL